MTPTRPLKRYCEGPPEYGLNIPASEYAEEGLRFLRTTDIGAQGGLADIEGVFAPGDPALEARHRLREGDLLFSRSGSLGRCLRFEADYGPATYADYLVRFRPRFGTDSRFLEYCAQSAPFRAAIEADAITSTISNFGAERYAEIRVADVPMAEQRAIADYLDAETARIDALIAKKQQLIHLLGERRRSQLEGLLWRGDVAPLEFVADVVPGYAFPSGEFGPDGTGPRLLRGTNVGIGRLDWSESVSLVVGMAPHPRYVLAENDVVLGMDRPFISAGTRVSEIGPSDAGCLLVQRVCRLRPTSNMSKVLVAAISSPRFRAHIESDLTGVSVPHLSDEQIGGFPVPVGPTEVLTKKIGNVNTSAARLLAPTHRQIGLLAEHRQALITAAVTGQFAVPRAA